MRGTVFCKLFAANVLFVVQLCSAATVPLLEPNNVKPEEMRAYYLKGLPAIKDYRAVRITRNPYMPPRLAPGESLVLVDLKGSGFITHIWWTGNWQNEWCKFYFDGETTPSIEGACADLFEKDSVTIAITRMPISLKTLPSHGQNCYIPMPFHTSVKVVMENRGQKPINDTYLIFDCILRSPKTVPECTLKYSPERRQFFYSGKGENEAIDPLRNEQAGINFVDQPEKAAKRIELAPGEVKEALSLSGTGMVERFNLVTDKPENIRLRITYEGAETYAIDCPADKFFGKLNSLVLESNSTTHSCYLPMPFRKAWSMTLKNTGSSAIEVGTKAVYQTIKSLPKNYAYLHARYNEGVGQAGEAYPLMDATGKGHFVGVLLYHTTSPVKPTDHAGADMIYGDAQTDSPFAIRAIGGEDYFCAAYFGSDYATPHVGATQSYMDGGMRYRFHLESPVPFTKSLNVDFTIFPGNGYQSVAFWYQDSPEPTLPAFRIPWRCIGPFNAHLPQGDMLSARFEPESAMILNKIYDVELITPQDSVCKRTAQWRTRFARGGFVDFNAENTQPFGYPPGLSAWAIDTVSYATTCINSSRDQNATLVVGHDDPIELFLNGKSIVKLPLLPEFKTQEVRVKLAAGKNRLMVKNANTVHPVNFIWDGFSLVVKDKHDKLLPDDCFTLD